MQNSAQANLTRQDYAGFWLRAIAFLIDTVVVFFLSLPITFDAFVKIAALKGSTDAVDAATGHITFSAYWLCYFANLCYFTIFECTKQATPGKMLVGLEVTDKNGKKLGFFRALARNLCKYFSGLPLCFGYIMAGFTRRRQALHDLMAGCLVMHKSQSKETKWTEAHHKHGTSWTDPNPKKPETISAVSSTETINTVSTAQSPHAVQISSNTTDGAAVTTSQSQSLPLSQSTDQQTVKAVVPTLVSTPSPTAKGSEPPFLPAPAPAVSLPISVTTNSQSQAVAVAVTPEMPVADTVDTAGASSAQSGEESASESAEKACRTCGATLDKSFSFCLKCFAPVES